MANLIPVPRARRPRIAFWTEIQPFFDSFETRIIRLIALLGVPYLALGVLCFLLQTLGFHFSHDSPAWSAMLALLFFAIVASVTACVLSLWFPRDNESSQREDSHSGGSPCIYIIGAGLGPACAKAPSDKLIDFASKLLWVPRGGPHPQTDKNAIIAAYR